MLRGNLIAGYQEEMYATENEGSVRAAVEDVERDVTVGVYAYKDRIIVLMLTSDGTVTELTRIHTSENAVIHNNDAEGRYQ